MCGLQLLEERCVLHRAVDQHLPVYSLDETSIMPVHMGHFMGQRKEKKEKDRDKMRGGKRQDGKQSGKE